MPSLTLSLKTTRRLIQTAVDIHPRQSHSGARRSLLKPCLRAIPTRPARYTPRPASRLPQSSRHLRGLANVTSAAPQRFEFLLQFHRKNTRRLMQTAIDIHPRKSRSGASRSLQIPRLRVAFFTRVDACHSQSAAAVWGPIAGQPKKHNQIEAKRYQKLIIFGLIRSEFVTKPLCFLNECASQGQNKPEWQG